MASENLTLTREKREELERILEEIASDVGALGFDEDEVYGCPFLHAIEEYETPNFTVKIEIKGGTEEADAHEEGAAP